MVYAVAALVFLFYLSKTPVQFGVQAQRGRPVRLGVMFGPVRFRFSGTLAKEIDGAWSARLLPEGGGKERKLALSGEIRWTDAAASARKPAMYLLRHIKAVRLRAFFLFSSGDAARDALLCGFVSAVLQAARAVHPDSPLRAKVQVDWQGKGTQAAFLGIWSIQAGHIILAALLGAGDYLVRRIRVWRSTRYKEL